MEDSIAPPKIIENINVDSLAIGFDMLSDPLTGGLLRMLAASKPAGNLLELGSGTGLATAWLLDGMDRTSRLTTIDNDPQLLEILTRHIGDDPRLEVVCSDGDEFIKSIARQKFDLIFADTWAGKYRLLAETISLLKVGGLYIIDDMLPQPNWPVGHADKVAELILTLDRHPDLNIVKMSWASGIIIGVKSSPDDRTLNPID
jgi:predicted O-methyltransferase YrrM